MLIMVLTLLCCKAWIYAIRTEYGLWNTTFARHIHFLMWILWRKLSHKLTMQVYTWLTHCCLELGTTQLKHSIQVYFICFYITVCQTGRACYITSKRSTERVCDSRKQSVLLTQPGRQQPLWADRQSVLLLLRFRLPQQNEISTAHIKNLRHTIGRVVRNAVFTAIHRFHILPGEALVRRWANVCDVGPASDKRFSSLFFTVPSHPVSCAPAQREVCSNDGKKN